LLSIAGLGTVGIGTGTIGYFTLLTEAG